MLPLVRTVRLAMSQFISGKKNVRMARHEGMVNKYFTDFLNKFVSKTNIRLDQAELNSDFLNKI